MMPATRRAKAVAAVALAVALVSVTLTGCSPSATAAKHVALPTGAPTASGTFNEQLAFQSAWHIVAKSKYVTGATDSCDLSLAISIENDATLASSNTNLPVFGFVMRDGAISYGTVWPTPVPGTGIVDGSGTYAISYDSAGLPTTARGVASIKWHDPKATPAVSDRSDTITVTFTKESRTTHCPQ